MFNLQVKSVWKQQWAFILHFKQVITVKIALHALRNTDRIIDYSIKCTFLGWKIKLWIHEIAIKLSRQLWRRREILNKRHTDVDFHKQKVSLFDVIFSWSFISFYIFHLFIVSNSYFKIFSLVKRTWTPK